MKITYLAGTRHEYSIGVSELDSNTILLTGMGKLGAGLCNGEVYYRSVVVTRDQMVDTTEAKVDIWNKCGIVGRRENNVEVVQAICDLWGIENPGVYVCRIDSHGNETARR